MMLSIILSFFAVILTLGTAIDMDSWVYLGAELSMPRVGFGSCGLKHTRQMTCTAIKNGVKLVDSAQAREWYDEAEVGRAIQNEECGATRDLVVVTKVHPRSYEIDAMRASLEKSAIDLYGNKRKLDVALLHAPFCWEGQCNREQLDFLNTKGWYSAWRNLEKMHDEGLVSAIGVSNFHPHQLLELLSFANKRVAVVQNFMDPFHQDGEVRGICRDHGIAYMAYSSLGNQWWRRGNPIFGNELLNDIAAEHNSTVSSVVLHWVLSTGAVIIPKSSKVDHIVTNANILTDGMIYLTSENIEAISRLDGTIGNPWD